MWCGVVGGIWVGKASWYKIPDVDFDSEGGFGGQYLAGGGIGNDGGDHVGLSWDFTHDNSITGSMMVLTTVGKCLAGAEVDEIGGIGGGN